MVRFTSGEIVPLAVTTVGKALVSAFAVRNSSVWSVPNVSGSRVTGALLVAAGVSFEQASPPASTATTNTSEIHRGEGRRHLVWLRL